MSQSTAPISPCRMHFSCRRGRRILLLLAAAFSLFAGGVVAAENDAPSQDETATFASENTGDFEYALEGREDPFVPFITEKAAAAKVNMDEIVDINEPLTGMQLFEPGQLQLVALLVKGNEDIAMVEDFTGKGYVLKEGTKIGRRGVVKDIGNNAVLIEETAVTRAGRKIITEVVMLLKKEKEE